MKKTALVILGVLIGICTTSCLPDATDEEIKQMCGKLVELRGEVDVVTVTDAVTVVKKEYTQKQQELEKKQAEALKYWEQENEETLSKASTDAEKKKIEEEIAKGKEEIITKYKVKLENLNPLQNTEIKKVTVSAQRSQADWEEAVGKCVTSSKAEGVKQSIAQCRIAAMSVDKYWNACR
ncbi:MAG: hypothetical protein GY847_37545 [Proteobacteria bacterium]|nr:hypothetical protein [Pseudomonadota bacterium]